MRQALKLLINGHLIVNTAGRESLLVEFTVQLGRQPDCKHECPQTGECSSLLQTYQFQLIIQPQGFVLPLTSSQTYVQICLLHRLSASFPCSSSHSLKVNFLPRNFVEKLSWPPPPVLPSSNPSCTSFSKMQLDFAPALSAAAGGSSIQQCPTSWRDVTSPCLGNSSHVVDSASPISSTPLAPHPRDLFQNGQARARQKCHVQGLEVTGLTLALQSVLSIFLFMERVSKDEGNLLKAAELKIKPRQSLRTKFGFLIQQHMKQALPNDSTNSKSGQIFYVRMPVLPLTGHCDLKQTFCRQFPHL